ERALSLGEARFALAPLGGPALDLAAPALDVLRQSRETLAEMLRFLRDGLARLFEPTDLLLGFEQLVIQAHPVDFQAVAFFDELRSARLRLRDLRLQLAEAPLFFAQF